MWESHLGMRVGKLTIWVSWFQIEKIIAEFIGSISSTRISLLGPMMVVKVSKDKDISKCADRKSVVCVRWNNIKNHPRGWFLIVRGKRSKTLSKEKPVKNISKNPQSYLRIRPVQKEIFYISCTTNQIKGR